MIQYIESEPSSQTPRNAKRQNHRKQQRTPTNAQSRVKVALMRSKSKQNFLTDPQTSDHTQKSTSSTKIRIQMLQQKLHKLQKQNSELRQQIITMKANQFYTINEQKVKMAIQQNQKLRREICEIRKINEQFSIQNEFLQRNNRNLKEKLQELANTNLRKSVDASKSRALQNTARKIKNLQEGPYQRIDKQIEDKIEIRNPLQYSSTKYRKKTIEHVKSNPNLAKYHVEEDSEFVSKQRQGHKASQKQQKKNKFSNDQSNTSNEHFLKEFQKYQKQLTSHTNNRNQINTLYSSRGETDLRDQSHQTEQNKLNGMKMLSKQSRGKRSKSKETSLQTILNRKKQFMNRKGNNQLYIGQGQLARKDTDLNDKWKDQNDQNLMRIGNSPIKYTFNEEYLIGKSTKQSNKNYVPTHSSPSQRPYQDYGNSRRNYRS